MADTSSENRKEYIRIPDNMSLLDYILSLPDDDELAPEFVEKMHKIMNEKPVFTGTIEELDNFLDGE